MSAKKIKNTAKVLLLLYIGYFSCVSYFIHTHVYNGVVYVHSHPYKKWAKDSDDNKQPPFETHHHTAAGFFTFNQLSSITSIEAQDNSYITELNIPVYTIDYKQLPVQNIVKPVLYTFNYRAPPFFTTC